MNSFQSSIFPDASVIGYVKQHSPEDVTLRDEGEFPSTPNTLKMQYDFDVFKLHIESDKYESVSISTTDLFAKDMWNNRVREVYSSIDSMIQEIIPLVKEDPEYLAFKGNRVSQNPLDSQWFKTNVAYPDFSGEIDETKVHEYLKEIPAVKTEGTLELHNTLELYLENGIKAIAVKTFLGYDLNFVADQRHTKEQLEYVINTFDPESKGWSNNPTNENTRGTDFRFGINSTYFRLPFMLFEDDVKQLPVIAFGEQSPYL